MSSPKELSKMQAFCCDYCKCTVYKKNERFTHRLGLRGTGFRIIRCINCGLLSLFPSPTEEELEDIYCGYASKKGRLLVEKVRKENVYPLKFKKLKTLAYGNRLLDIGAGLGTFARMARDFGFDAVGVEYESEQCEKARELWGVNLVNGGIEDVYQDLGYFDVVNLHHVLEHVRSPRKVLDIVYELLKPGGVAAIEVPNQFFNVAKEIRLLVGNHISSRVNCLDHLYFFSPRTIEAYVDTDRFEIVEFNQFRPREKSMPMWERIPKDLYRFIIDKTGMGGGSFFELYIRKKIFCNRRREIHRFEHN